MPALYYVQGTKVDNRWDSLFKISVGEADAHRCKGAFMWRGERMNQVGWDMWGGPGDVQGFSWNHSGEMT